MEGSQQEEATGHGQSIFKKETYDELKSDPSTDTLNALLKEKTKLKNTIRELKKELQTNRDEDNLVLSIQLKRATAETKKVEEALELMKRGNYGICDICNKPISPKRLGIFPHTRLCVRCAAGESDLTY